MEIDIYGNTTVRNFLDAFFRVSKIEGPEIYICVVYRLHEHVRMFVFCAG